MVVNQISDVCVFLAAGAGTWYRAIVAIVGLAAALENQCESTTELS